MMQTVGIGLIAAVVASSPRLIRAYLPGSAWTLPAALIGVAAVAVLLQKVLLARRPTSCVYDGTADLFLHVHSPADPVRPACWAVRGAISWLLSLFGVAVGPEGAASEVGHAASFGAQARSSRWFEQRRRTDVAAALAAGIAASMGAPFGAVLVTVELGLGGRAISVATTAIVAFLASRGIDLMLLPAGMLQEALGGELIGKGGAIAGASGAGWRDWVMSPVIGLGVGAAGTLLLVFTRFGRSSLDELLGARQWLRPVVGGALLFLVYFAVRDAQAPAHRLLSDALLGRMTTPELALILTATTVSVTLVASAFGSIGVFWPVWLMGAMGGLLLHAAIPDSVIGSMAIAGLSGAAGLWGAVLGAPFSGAVVAYEWGGNIEVFAPVFLAAYAGRGVRRLFGLRSWFERDLEMRGLPIEGGRSLGVLDSVVVQDAMVKDHEVVLEHESVAQAHSRLLQSRYPFLPVVSARGQYRGILTVEMVQEGWKAQDPLAANLPLSSLLEAKDLLYRSGLRARTVRATDRLSQTIGLFDQMPCLVVLTEDSQVAGLLFVYHVRLAYDREVARQALLGFRRTES